MTFVVNTNVTVSDVNITQHRRPWHGVVYHAMLSVLCIKTCVYTDHFHYVLSFDAFQIANCYVGSSFTHYNTTT